MSFKGCFGSYFCVGLYGKFELRFRVGFEIFGVGGKVIVEDAVDAQCDEKVLIFFREMGELEGELGSCFDQTGYSGEDAHEGAIHAFAPTHIKINMCESGVFDFLLNERFEGGADSKGATSSEADVDLVIYFGCREIILSVGIRQTLSLTLRRSVALGGVRSTCLFVLGRDR